MGLTAIRSAQREPRATAPPRGGSSHRWWLLGFVAVLGVSLAAVVGILANGSGSESVDAAGLDTEYTQQGSVEVAVAPPAASETTIRQIVRAEPPSLTVWPPSGRGRRFAEPRAAALDFATAYVGFNAPHVGEYRPSGEHTGLVPVRPTIDGPSTHVLVHQVAADGSWWVLGASTENIVIDEPTVNTRIDDPLHVSGLALPVTGVLEMELREGASTEPLLRSNIVTGGGAEPQWFEGGFGWNPSNEATGALLFLIRDPEDDTVLEAAVMPVRLPTSEPRADE